jgi:hypothetical protein
MSLRCHARMVSGWTTVATSLRALRPSRKPISPSVARSASESRKHPLNWARKMRFSAALGHANRADREWISGFLARPRERRLPREVLRLHQILANGGSIGWAQRSAAAFAEAAAREFHSSAFAGVPASPDLGWLRACVDFLVQREA